jgi:hypothetical protein
LDICSALARLFRADDERLLANAHPSYVNDADRSRLQSAFDQMLGRYATLRYAKPRTRRLRADHGRKHDTGDVMLTRGLDAHRPITEALPRRSRLN